MKKNIVLSTVLAAALIPAISMSAEQVNSFEQDARLCDSWTWQDDNQSTNKRSDRDLVAKQANIEVTAFGDARYSIGW